MSLPQLKTIRSLIYIELANIVDYFLSLSPEDDKRMGTDRKNLPTRDKWIQMLIDDSHQPIEQRQFYYLGFFLDNTVIGHAGINKVNFGHEAYIHFHIWKPQLHQQGLGNFYLKEAVQYYFHHFKLKKIICEPNVENIAPNKTLLKISLILKK